MTYSTEIRYLRQSLHKLIHDLHEQKLRAFAADLDVWAEKKMASSPQIDTVLKKLGMMEKKIHSMESAHTSFSRQLIPTKKLLDIDAKLKTAKTRHGDAVLKVIEKKQKTRERELSRRISALSTAMNALAGRCDARSTSLEKRMQEKETELRDMISQGDMTVNKKVNARFLKWLDGLEASVKNRVENSLEDIEHLHRKFDELEKQNVTRADLEKVEEAFTGPLGSIDRKIERAVKREVSRMETRLRPTRSSTALRKEINRALSELERQRTDVFAEELERQERLKKKRR